jgi:hypothetical protein
MFVAALIRDNKTSVQAVAVHVKEPRVGILCQRSGPASWEPLWALRDGRCEELPSWFTLDGECSDALEEVLTLIEPARGPGSSAW